MHNSGDSRLLSRAVLLAVTLAFALLGCYTVLKHPITSEEGPQGQVHHSQAYYRQNCVDCHADYSEYPYGYFYGTYPEYYFEYPRWGYYYAYPWWWDYGWYDGEPEPQDPSVSETPGSAKASRRGGMVPPYVDRTPAVWDNATSTGGYRAPSTGAATGKAGETSGSGTAGSGSQGTKTRVRIGGQPSADSTAGSTEKQTEQKKADRRGGTPPPK